MSDQTLPRDERQLPPDTRVRITASEGRRDEAAVGHLLLVGDYCSAAESDLDDGTPFYWGTREDGFSERWFLEANAELVQTAEQVQARRPPTPDEIAREFGWLSGHSDDFEFDESDPEGDGVVKLYGKTHDGLRIAVKVRIESVEQVDF